MDGTVDRNAGAPTGRARFVRRRIAGVVLLATLATTVAVACYQVTAEDVWAGSEWDPMGEVYAVVLQPRAAAAVRRDWDACRGDSACVQDELLHHWDLEALGADRARFVEGVTGGIDDLRVAVSELERRDDNPCLAVQARLRFSTSVPAAPPTPAWRVVPPGAANHCTGPAPD